MENQKIVLYGCGYRGTIFVKEYGTENIAFCIDNQRSAGTFYGKPVFPFADVRDSLSDKIVVIAIDNLKVYQEISEQLDQVGLTEFESYIHYRLYDRKIAFLWGNCHMGVIARVLSYQREFSSQYAIVPFRPIYSMKITDKLINALAHADLFISQDVRDNNSYGYDHSKKYLEGHLRESCLKITVPNLYGMPKFLFPQTYCTDTFQAAGGTVDWYRDRYLDEILNKDYTSDVEDVVKILESIQFDYESVMGGWKAFLIAIRKREAYCDIIISDWIAEHISDEKLFFDVRHPSVSLLLEMSKRILDFLKFDNIIFPCELTGSYGHEVPVYNGIRKIFGMTWDPGDLKATNRLEKLRDVYMDLTEYAEEYMTVYRADENDGYNDFHP